MFTQDFNNKRAVVVGLGHFGGGAGVTRWLAEQGARVLVTDLADEQSLQSSLARLRDLSLEYRLGKHDVADLEGADLVVVNPAVDKASSELIRSAVARKIPLTSEMNLFFERCHGKIIGVSGSIGKSTTTAMVFDILQTYCDRLGSSPVSVWLGGNIGASLLSDLPQIAPEDYVVLELSSFQLEDLAYLPASSGECCIPHCHIAVLTNLFPHHLERHGDLSTYLRCKMNLFTGQTKEDFAVVSEQAGSALQENGFAIVGPELQTFSGAGELQGQLRVPGDHQLQNAAAAQLVCRLVGLDDEVILKGLQQFAGLAHRLEWVRQYRGVDYYNDSKSTIPRATIIALEAFSEKVVLLVGGYDQPVDYEQMARAICDRARAVICFGGAGEKIATSIKSMCRQRSEPAVEIVHEFAVGVDHCRELALPGEVVLLSPGCPSFDAYANYQQRGDIFKSLVADWG